MTIPKSSFKKIAVAAAAAGDARKAHPVTIFDLAGKSPLADYAVLLAAESAPQLDAIEEEVQIRLKQEGIYCLHRDGMRSKNWKVLDYGGVLVHIYDAKAAEFYAIDKVYEGYKTVEWEVKSEPKAEIPAGKKPAAKKPAAKKAGERTAVKKAPVNKAAKKSAAPKKALKKSKLARKAVKTKKSKPVKKNSKKKWPSDEHSS